MMQEIFWGDYDIDEKKAIEMIRSGSEYKKRFMFGKILANSQKNYFFDESCVIRELRWIQK